MGDSSQEIMVRCQGLTKVYNGEIKALDNLNLSIPRAHIFGYIGHNGAGKTTTIRILAGLLKASSGQASVAGVNVDANLDKIKSLVGYMPDHFGVYDQMRVWEYLDFFGAAFKLPRRKRRDRLDYVLEITEAEYLRDRFVDTLSRGMKQRVGIARTLMHDPQVLLLDEPASGLDPRARVQMRHLLRRLADSGKTLLVSSHILPELAAVCDSVGIIHQGSLRAYGEIDEVLSELKRDRLMEIRAAAGLDEAVERLEAHEHVLPDPQTGAKVDRGDEATGVLRFRFSGDDETLAGVLGDLLAAGTKVVTFREVPLSLEDAYMALSGMPAVSEETSEASAAPPAASGAAG